jgi:hypothetical protein
MRLGRTWRVDSWFRLALVLTGCLVALALIAAAVEARIGGRVFAWYVVVASPAICLTLVAWIKAVDALSRDWR